MKRCCCSWPLQSRVSIYFEAGDVTFLSLYILIQSFTMSVVFENTKGCVLDPRSLIDRGYSRCIRWRDDQKSHVKCCFKRQCFQITKSHYSVTMDAGNAELVQKTDFKPAKVKCLRRNPGLVKHVQQRHPLVTVQNTPASLNAVQSETLQHEPPKNSHIFRCMKKMQLI